MALDEFDCIVLGDEPAGLWLLTELAKLSRSTGKAARLGLLSLGEEPRRVPFPARLASDFGIEVDRIWHAEVLTPTARFLWEEKTLEERFPFLSVHDLVSSPLRLAARDKLAQKTILKHPDLFLFAKGIWKFLGRTSRLRPETILVSALMATDLCSWEPLLQLPEALEKFHVNPAENPIEEIRRVRSDLLLFKCREKEAWLTRKLVINCPLRQLTPFCSVSADLLRWLPVRANILSRSALFPLALAVENEVVPVPVQPLNFFFETTEVPDTEREVWPFEMFKEASTKTLTLWAQGPREIAPEFLAERFRQGVQQLQKLFPHLASGLKSLSLPLSAGDCLSEDRRSVYYDHLELSARESYAAISLEARTRLHPLRLLSPFVQCHLPYPLGPLQQAQKTLREFFLKQKSRQKEASCLLE